MASNDLLPRRLVNLTMALMAARRPMTVADIVTGVEGYGDSPDPADAAVRRMFERDKSRLRACGIPIETSGAHNDEVGYRIPVDEAVLPPLDLTPGEAGALALAARSWSQGTLAVLADRALAKIEAAGGLRAPAPRLVLQPRLDGEGPALEVVLPAVVARQAVTFDYRAADGTTTSRTLEPWGAVSWRRRWYLTGHDRDRGEQRTFRLGRVVGATVTPVGEPGAFEVPAEVDLRAQLDAFSEEPVHEAVVHLRPGSGLTLRAGATITGRTPDGWDVLALRFGEVHSFAGWLRTFAGDLVAVSPRELVAAVREGWEALA